MAGRAPSIRVAGWGFGQKTCGKGCFLQLGAVFQDMAKRIRPNHEFVPTAGRKRVATILASAKGEFIIGGVACKNLGQGFGGKDGGADRQLRQVYAMVACKKR